MSEFKDPDYLALRGEVSEIRKQLKKEELRDYFAGQALAGLLGNAQIAKDAVKIQILSDANQEWHARTAYEFADAMLKARES